jgi:subtilisin family serine protease
LGFLIGLVAAAPLTLVDPDELVLVVSSSPGEMLGLSYQAAIISTLMLLVCGFFSLLVLWLRRPKPDTTLPITHRVGRLNFGLAVAALTAVALGALIYFVSGQPGLYGERMFVILEEQADVSSATSIQDYTARRQFVYQTLVEHANTTQADLRRSLDRLGVDYTPYYLVNALEISGNPLLRLWLMSRPEVGRILDSPRMRPLPEELPSSPGRAEAPTEPKWNLTNIGADRVWQEFGVTGQGIVVGQSDSGVQGDHPELAGAYRGNDGQNDYNWFDPWNHTTQPVDVGGHGTHTLGSILGQHTGVAPGASWIACVNLARNLGNPALYLDCMQFMLAPFPLGGDPLADGDPSRGAHVLNNSWGCPEIEGCDANTFLYAVRALRTAGIFVVVSAGNDGPKCNTLNTPPPIYQEVFSIGAIDRTGELAFFSSIGPVTSDGSGRVKPDLLAPGVQVLSALPESSYGENSGTSMAGPHVAGVVALLWSANPSLIGDIDRTVQILTESAQPYEGSLPDCPGVNDLPSTAAGYGIVDAYAAVQMALGR